MLKTGYLFLSLIAFTLSMNAQDFRLELNKIVNQAFTTQANKGKVINLAANNKMLSQKMAKSAVYIVNNIDVETHHKDLLDSAKTFNNFIIGLQEGNAALQLEKADDKEVLSELDEVNIEWKAFDAQIKKFYVNGKVDESAYQYIINNNEKLLRLSHKLTQTLKSKNLLNANDNKVIGHTLKIADRQRMLTQKMFKEKFLIYTKQDAKRNSIRLRGSIILFKNGLNGLINGDNKRGLAKVTNKNIQKKLQEMLALYQEVEKIYIQESMNDAEMKRLSIIDKKLLNTSTQIVNMVENTLVY
ncbi:type IV pili methyl-accepting chemotaxis transducer N-terminal domain-containing protein [bacterium]|nr:type IV pili methyl-accepting chemotaxis transducer N-terminal domain-containing protein [bacterium]MBU1957343.1 type IV pili methyl-accepting chemotaxis transducer N-terminal domain-containing protein [bacterium]